MKLFVLAQATTAEAARVEPWWAIILMIGLAALIVCAVMAESIRR